MGILIGPPIGGLLPPIIASYTSMSCVGVVLLYVVFVLEESLSVRARPEVKDSWQGWILYLDGESILIMHETNVNSIQNNKNDSGNDDQSNVSCNSSSSSSSSSTRYTTIHIQISSGDADDCDDGHQQHKSCEL